MGRLSIYLYILYLFSIVGCQSVKNTNNSSHISNGSSSPSLPSLPPYTKYNDLNIKYNGIDESIANILSFPDYIFDVYLQNKVDWDSPDITKTNLDDMIHRAESSIQKLFVNKKDLPTFKNLFNPYMGEFKGVSDFNSFLTLFAEILLLKDKRVLRRAKL